MKEDISKEKNKEYYGNKTKAVPKPKVDINVDTEDTLIRDTLDAIVSDKGSVDYGELQSFLTVAQNRDRLYSLIDTMCQDSTIAAALEIYAEYATEPNDKGEIIWAESDDAEVQNYINYILGLLKVNKHAYQWIMSFCKYGNLYLKLFKESEILKDKASDSFTTEEEKKRLNEEIKIRVNKKNDPYAYHAEMVVNPAEMFELTKYDETRGFIKADVNSQYKPTNGENVSPTLLLNQYKFKKSDITLESATSYVHMALMDTVDRTSEEVSIFTNNEIGEEVDETFKVRTGQSIFYNTFRIWRLLSLLETSILLNRITKSSVLRIVNVDVGDRAKEQVQQILMGIKSLFEQKSAIAQNTSMTEYTNPGPMENTIYNPTHGEKGMINISQSGGDVNVTGLDDLNYFSNKLYGSLKVLKQYLGQTDDNTGFNGGTSLAQLSSRFAKTIERIQTQFIEGVTTLIDILLYSHKTTGYIGRYKLKMQPPVTQEQIDRQNNMSTRVQLTRDILDMVTQNIEDDEIKLRVLKTLLAGTGIVDSDVIGAVEEAIEKLENAPSEESTSSEEEEFGGEEESSSRPRPSGGVRNNIDNILGLNNEEETTTQETNNIEIPEEEPSNTLPTPQELGIDMTQNGGEEI